MGLLSMGQWPASGLSTNAVAAAAQTPIHGELDPAVLNNVRLTALERSVAGTAQYGSHSAETQGGGRQSGYIGRRTGETPGLTWRVPQGYG